MQRDIAREKQTALANRLGQLEHQRASLEATTVDHVATHRQSARPRRSLRHCLRDRPESVRRDFNQAWFERILLDVEADETVVHTAERADIFEILATSTVDDDAKPARQEVVNMRTHSIVKVRWSPLWWSQCSVTRTLTPRQKHCRFCTLLASLPLMGGLSPGPIAQPTGSSLRSLSNSISA